MFSTSIYLTPSVVTNLSPLDALDGSISLIRDFNLSNHLSVSAYRAGANPVYDEEDFENECHRSADYDEMRRSMSTNNWESYSFYLRTQDESKIVNSFNDLYCTHYGDSGDHFFYIHDVILFSSFQSVFSISDQYDEEYPDLTCSTCIAFGGDGFQENKHDFWQHLISSSLSDYLTETLRKSFSFDWRFAGIYQT